MFARPLLFHRTSALDCENGSNQSIQVIGDPAKLEEKYRKMGRNMRLIEAIMYKSENNYLKMGLYGAYYLLFTEETKREARIHLSNPKDSTIKLAWNYPQVNGGNRRQTGL